MMRHVPKRMLRNSERKRYDEDHVGVAGVPVHRANGFARTAARADAPHRADPPAASSII
jgi:hypothetical protein